MRYHWLPSAIYILHASAQITTGTQSITTITGSTFASSFTGTYSSLDGQQITVSSTGLLIAGDTTSSSTFSDGGNATATSTSWISQGTTNIVTLLLGGGLGLETISIINGTTTISPSTTATPSSTLSTLSAPRPSNTQACNGYPEFCARKYSNITHVCAHNSAFIKAGNVAANQALDITTQLNDGIRMIQGETHHVNGTMYSCHTSCDLLNAGTFQSELETVAAWVQAHPYDVVTILIVNSDYVDVSLYVDPIQNSGLAPYLYEPPKVPMHLDDWPTLSEMILTQKRVVVFLDYNANHTKVPYVLDEFSQMWETPFSPQNVSFPCTVQRPPTLTNMTNARDRFLYLANHNLNQEISFAGQSFLIPDKAQINTTNAAGNDTGMLGDMAETCYNDWGRAPNFLLVDFYNVGNGSVFEVAARYNNVTYDRKCCGVTTSGAASSRFPWAVWITALMTTAACLV